ncbi:hypothetical protein BH24CHL9_BH24CHL9_00100 [soil metagenome]
MVECASELRRYELAQRYLVEAAAHMDAHDFSFYHPILGIRRAELALEQGDWDAAGSQAQALLALPSSASRVRVRALTLVGRLEARRGTGDPWVAFDGAMAASSPHEPQERSPLHAARAEAAWLCGDPERTWSEAERGLALAFEPSSSPEPWWWAELAWWA